MHDFIPFLNFLLGVMLLVVVVVAYLLLATPLFLLFLFFFRFSSSVASLAAILAPPFIEIIHVAGKGRLPELCIDLVMLVTKPNT